MPSRHSAIAVLTMAALVLTASACRQREPEDRYNYNLAGDTDDRPLLPAVGTYHRAHDQGILSGRTQATIIKRDDIEAVAEAVAEAAARTEPEPERAPVEMAPASGVGEALGNVGKAFLGNLLGTPAPPGEGDATGGELAGTALPAADAEAIQQLVSAYNQAHATKEFPALTQYCVDRQQTEAEEFFDLKDELNASLEAFLEAFDKVTPGVKAQAERQMTAALTPLVLSGLSGSGDDTAATAAGTLALAGGARRVSVSFEREEGQWRMVHPTVPSETDWPGVKSTFEEAINDLDELSEALARGDALDQTRAQQTLQTALTLLLDLAES